MRIFLAGASGVMGTRLVPLLVADGHHVLAMTRSASKVEGLRSLRAEPVVCDVYDPAALRIAVTAAAPDVVMHQLTDLPDDADLIPESAAANVRIRTEGTRNLLAAAEAARRPRFFAQSVAWKLPGRGAESIAEFEALVIAYGGTVLRYGQWYGPGTYHETPPPPPRIHIDEAARRTVEALRTTESVLTLVEDEEPG